MTNPIQAIRIIAGHFGIGKGEASEKKPATPPPKPKLGIAIGSSKIQKKNKMLKEAMED